MTLLPNAAPGSARPESIRTLIIACDGDMNKITVRDDYASTSFEQIEVAIDDFAAQYDLRTISLTPEELKEEAEKAFYKAEDLFENYEARPENLRKAIERYKITVDFLDCFSPKPKMWDIARKKEQQARALLDERIKNLDFDFRRAMRLNQLETSLELAGQMLKTAYPDSRDYKKYENVKLKLEAKIRRMKRK
jgi:hypothetical protein